MLHKIIKPYRIFVSDKARAAGFEDQNFANKKAAKAFVRAVQKVDPDFAPSLRIFFRYYDTATGQRYGSRFDYEREEARRREWRQQYEADLAKKSAAAAE